MLRGECRRRRRKNNGKPTRNIRKPYCVLSELKVDRGFPQGALSGKEPTCLCRRHKRWVGDLGWEDVLEEEMATHSSILAWRIPWSEEPGRLQFIEVQRVRHVRKQLSSTQGLPQLSSG